MSTNNTVPFDQAPDCVNRALKIITDRASCVLNGRVSFNEILTAAYMERQSMSVSVIAGPKISTPRQKYLTCTMQYHTDDEKGLGHTVASLSMGATADMHFRLRKRVFKEQQQKLASTGQLPAGEKERVNSDRLLTIVLRHVRSRLCLQFLQLKIRSRAMCSLWRGKISKSYMRSAYILCGYLRRTNVSPRY